MSFNSSVSPRSTSFSVVIENLIDKVTQGVILNVVWPTRIIERCASISLASSAAQTGVISVISYWLLVTCFLLLGTGLL